MTDLATPSLITEQVDLSPLERIFAEFKTTPAAPRVRQLDVTDEQCIELLAGIATVVLTRRKAGLEVGLPALEMLAVLTTMVQG